MYIIENGCAYLIRGEEAFRVKFDADANITITEEAISPLGHIVYTYDEMMRKLNVKYIISMKKQELVGKKALFESEEYLSLKAENERLTKENNSLKQELEELKNKPVSTKKSDNKKADNKVEA